MSRVIADGLSKRATATAQEAEDAVEGKYPDAAGVHAAFNQYGLGSYLPASTEDLNTLVTTGFYGVSSAAPNNPLLGGGTLIVTGYADDRVVQMVSSVVDGKSYVRGLVNTTWSSWRMVFDSGNVANQIEAEAGSINDKPMTPLRVQDALNFYGVGFLIPFSDFNASGIFTPSETPRWYQSGFLPSNSPGGSNWWTMFTLGTGIGGSDFRFIQHAYDQTNPRTFYRTVRYNGGALTFGDWQEFFHTGNLDIEKGTWTPTLPNGGTISSNSAVYSKVFDQVTLQFYVLLSNIPNDGLEFRIGGLPFNVASISGLYPVGMIGYNQGNTTADITLLAKPNVVYCHKDGSAQTVTNSEIVSRGINSLILQITYKTN